jgi:hypothetical protein
LLCCSTAGASLIEVGKGMASPFVLERSFDGMGSSRVQDSHAAVAIAVKQMGLASKEVMYGGGGGPTGSEEQVWGNLWCCAR